jgi:hypothetical protein
MINQQLQENLPRGTHSAHPILDDTEQIPHCDARTGSIQQCHIPFPRKSRTLSFGGGPGTKSSMKHSCHDEKEQEYDDLENQTTKNDVHPCIGIPLAFRIGEYTATAALNEEAQNIPRNEDPGDPLWRDNRV